MVLYLCNKISRFFDFFWYFSNILLSYSSWPLINTQIISINKIALYICKDFHLFQFADYQKYIRNECLSENPAMKRSIALCNGISQWVQLMVLSRPTPQLRAEVFTKFIYVAQVTFSTFQQHHQDVLPPQSFNESDPLTIID